MEDEGIQRDILIAEADLIHYVYKFGVVFCEENQKTRAEILMNSAPLPQEYTEFLNYIGESSKWNSDPTIEGTRNPSSLSSLDLINDRLFRGLHFALFFVLVHPLRQGDLLRSHQHADGPADANETFRGHLRRRRLSARQEQRVRPVGVRSEVRLHPGEASTEQALLPFQRRFQSTIFYALGRRSIFL